MIGLNSELCPALTAAILQHGINALAAATQIKRAIGGDDTYSYRGDDLMRYIAEGERKVLKVLADCNVDHRRPATVAELRRFLLHISREIIKTLEAA